MRASIATAASLDAVKLHSPQFVTGLQASPPVCGCCSSDRLTGVSFPAQPQRESPTTETCSAAKRGRKGRKKSTHARSDFPQKRDEVNRSVAKWRGYGAGSSRDEQEARLEPPEHKGSDWFGSVCRRQSSVVVAQRSAQLPTNSGVREVKNAWIASRNLEHQRQEDKRGREGGGRLLSQIKKERAPSRNCVTDGGLRRLHRSVGRSHTVNWPRPWFVTPVNERALRSSRCRELRSSAQIMTSLSLHPPPNRAGYSRPCILDIKSFTPDCKASFIACFARVRGIGT